MNHFFYRFASVVGAPMGSHWTFLAAVVACVIWAVSGPAFDYSDTWQLVIDTATTVLTFLAVFLIQNTQNRNSLPVQLKLDELLRAVEEIEALRREFQRLHERENAKSKSYVRPPLCARPASIPKLCQHNGVLIRVTNSVSNS